MSEFLSSIHAQWEQRYLPDPGQGIRTPEAALAFFNQVGFCLFSYIPEVELPSLARAACRTEEPDTWGWKDSLPAARQVFYGAIFHPVGGWAARPGFVSLEMLAPLYSLAPILQFGGDKTLLRRYVKISLEAIAIAETLEREGSLSTGELRASTGLTGKANAGKFSRALGEAQAHFLVTKVGVTSITRANYGYVWGPFERVFADTARQAEMLPEREAAERIVLQYVQTALAVPLERIAEMLALDVKVLKPAAESLLVQGKIKTVEEEEIKYLVRI